VKKTLSVRDAAQLCATSEATVSAWLRATDRTTGKRGIRAELSLTDVRALHVERSLLPFVADREERRTLARAMATMHHLETKEREGEQGYAVRLKDGSWTYSPQRKLATLRKSEAITHCFEIQPATLTRVLRKNPDAFEPHTLPPR